MFRHLPNILTFGRLVLTVMFLIMILFTPKISAEQRPLFLDIAFVLFLTAALTDIADGKIARKYNITSKLGRIVDPLADKCLVCGAFICFALIGEPKLFGLSSGKLAVIQWTMVGILAARELFVTILRHRSEAKGIKFPATVSGKLKMLVQSFAIGTVVIKAGHVQTALWGYWFTAIVFVLTAGITIVSGLLSIRKVKVQN